MNKGTVKTKLCKLVENSTIKTITIPYRHFHNLKAMVAFSEITRLQLRFFAFMPSNSDTKRKKNVGFFLKNGGIGKVFRNSRSVRVATSCFVDAKVLLTRGAVAGVRLLWAAK